MDAATPSGSSRLEQAMRLALAYWESAEREPPETWLARHAHLRDLLEPMLEEPPEPAPDAVPPAPPAFREPETLGPFRLVRALGEGTFGKVYLAERTEPVRQLVALKVLKPDKVFWDHYRVRFQHECQVLAGLNHDGMARLFEAGTTELGQPYFAMEYVPGPPITDYCDEHGLDPAARIRLFARVCAAVHHAHQRGVLHRDLKPANVLVKEEDGRPVPKVIDFGIARPLQVDPGADSPARMTQPGTSPGTYEYMSPEQVAGDLDIDTRTDVYALGVILYELLCGSLPLTSTELLAVDLRERARLIHEKTPPVPARRVAQAPDADAQAARRGFPTGGAALARALRREPGWIVLKALAKERDRRYGSPEALKQDLERYLAGDPVEAGPPGLVYRARKLIRKHRGRVAAGIVAAFVVLAFAVSAVVVAARLRRASERMAAQGSVHYLVQAERLAANRRNAEARLAALRARHLSPQLELGAVWRTLVAEADTCPRLRWQAIRAVPDDPASSPARNSALVNVALDPAGRFLVAVTVGGRLVVRDAADGQVRASIQRAFDGLSVEAAVLARDLAAGTDHLVLGLSSGRLESWDLTDPDAPARLGFVAGPAGAVRALAVDRPGSRLFVLQSTTGPGPGNAQAPAVVRTWRLPLAAESEPEDRAVPVALEPADRLAISPDGATLLVWGGSNQALLVDLEPGRARYRKVLPDYKIPATVGWWGENLVAVARGERAPVWIREGRDFRSGPQDRPESARSWISPSPGVDAACVAGSRLVVGGPPEGARGPVVRVIDLSASGEPATEAVIPVPLESLRRLRVTPDGQTLVALGKASALCAWDLGSGPSCWRAPGTGPPARVAVAGTDRNRVLVSIGSTLRRYRLRDRALEEERPAVRLEAGASETAFVSAGGAGFVAVSQDGTVRVLDPITGAVQSTGPSTDGARPRAVAVDGSRPTIYLVAPGGRDVMAVDLDSGQRESLGAPPRDGEGWEFVALAAPRRRPILLALSANGVICTRSIAGPDSSGWTVPDRDALTPRATDACVLAVDAGGRSRAVGDSRGRMELREESASTPRSWPARPGFVQAAAFSPDGRILLWVHHGDTRVSLWCRETGETLRLATGHRAPVVSLAVLSAGRLLLTGDERGELRLLDLDALFRRPTDPDLARMERALGFYLDGYAFRPLPVPYPTDAPPFFSRWSESSRLAVEVREP